MDLQSLGGCWWSLQLQREHPSAEGQVVELRSLTEDGEQEGSFGKRVCGYLRLTAGRHLALLPLQPPIRQITSSCKKAITDGMFRKEILLMCSGYLGLRLLHL